MTPEIPEKLTRIFIEQHCDYHYVSFTGKWSVWIWRNVELLRLTGDFSIEDMDRFMQEGWHILIERKKRYSFVISLVDITDFEIQTEEFRVYLKDNWDHLLDRNDLQIVLIAGKEMKSIIWQSILLMMGKLDRVRFFASHKRAFKWVSKRISARASSLSPMQGEEIKEKESIPEKLTLEWVEYHSHIRLTGNGLRWIVRAWRNIIYMRISEHWSPEEVEDYVNHILALPTILTKRWKRIFFVFDLSRMKLKKEDAFYYLRPNVLEFHAHEDMTVCVVEKSKSRRLVWKSLYAAIGKLDKVKLFADCDEAFDWVRKNIIGHKNLTIR